MAVPPMVIADMPQLAGFVFQAGNERMRTMYQRQQLMQQQQLQQQQQPALGSIVSKAPKPEDVAEGSASDRAEAAMERDTMDADSSSSSSSAAAAAAAAAAAPSAKRGENADGDAVDDGAQSAKRVREENGEK